MSGQWKDIAFTCALLSALGLGGCALPQPVLDQANSSAHLMMQMQNQIDAMIDTQKSIAEQRVAAIKDQRQLTLQYNSSFAAYSRLRAAAGLTDQSQLYETLVGLSDAQVKDGLELEASLAALDDDLSKLLNAVPTTAKTVAAAQKDMAALGLPRSSKERLDFIKTYAETVKADVDADKKAAATAAAAAASAASAPIQAAPTDLHAKAS